MRILIVLFLFWCNLLVAQETYTIGSTTYYKNQYYRTGYPKVKRSKGNKKAFLEKIGLKVIPRGYQIDHIIPLSEGGTDSPSNMQLLSIKEHRFKTSKEIARRAVRSKLKGVIVPQDSIKAIDTISKVKRKRLFTG